MDWVVLPREGGNSQTCTRLFSKSDTNADQGRTPSTAENEFHQELWRINPDQNFSRIIQYRRINNRTFGLAGLGSHKPLHRLPGSGLVWARAEGSLRETEKIYVIGFSLSPFDALAHLYFVTAIQRRVEEEGKPLPETMVIDPNADQLASRFREIFGSHINLKKLTSESVDWANLLG